MKPQAPLLPEATFQALSEAKLEAMIDIALSHAQEQPAPRSGKVLAFPRRTILTNIAYSGGLAAMAASVLLAFLLTPATPAGSLTASRESAPTAELSDMILYDSLGA